MKLNGLKRVVRCLEAMLVAAGLGDGVSTYLVLHLQKGIESSEIPRLLQSMYGAWVSIPFALGLSLVMMVFSELVMKVSFLRKTVSLSLFSHLEIMAFLAIINVIWWYRAVFNNIILLLE